MRRRRNCWWTGRAGCGRQNVDILGTLSVEKANRIKRLIMCADGETLLGQSNATDYVCEYEVYQKRNDDAMKEVVLIVFGTVITSLVGILKWHFDRKLDRRSAFRDCILDLHASLDS